MWRSSCKDLGELIVLQPNCLSSLAMDLRIHQLISEDSVSLIGPVLEFKKERKGREMQGKLINIHLKVHSREAGYNGNMAQG